MTTTDPYEDVAHYLDWVVEPPDEIYYAMSASLDADAGLNEEYD